MKADINIKNVLNDKDTLSKLSSKAVKDSNLSLDKTIQTSSGQLIYFNTN